MTNELFYTSLVLAAATAILVVVTWYYAVQTRKILEENRKQFAVRSLEEELEVYGPLYSLADFIDEKIKEARSNGLIPEKLTAGVPRKIDTYLPRHYFDEVFIKYPHLIDETVRKYYLKTLETTIKQNRLHLKGVKPIENHIEIWIAEDSLDWVISIKEKYNKIISKLNDLKNNTNN